VSNKLTVTRHSKHAGR